MGEGKRKREGEGVRGRRGRNLRYITGTDGRELPFFFTLDYNQFASSFLSFVGLYAVFSNPRLYRRVPFMDCFPTLPSLP